VANGWQPALPFASPPVLYKYRAFDEDGLRPLRNREIFFASPSSLNDPLDCQIDVREHFESLVALHNETTNLGKLLRALREAKVTKVAGGPKVSLHESFNDTLKSGGVFCISATGTEPLLWSHYADGHRGFAIGLAGEYFDWLRHQFSTHAIAGFGPVSYPATPNLTSHFLQAALSLRPMDERERIEWIKSYAQDVISEVLSTKAKAWRYEKEYRSVRTRPGPVPFPPSALREIVFGRHADPQHQEQVRQLLAGSEWKHVRYRRADFVPLQFDLALSDL
jgi:hypothetical protein